MANLPVLGRNPSALTMSSREIAELVESRHDNVRRTMDTLQSKGLITITQTEEPTPGGGKPVTVYQVNKRDSYIVVAQLSPEFTARLVDRWQELEEQAALAQFDLPKTFPEALRQLADSTERNLELEAKIAADKPKVEFAEAVRKLDGSCLIREFAKVIGTGQNRLFQTLRDDGFLMANNEPYQQFVERGWFVVIEGTPFTDSNGRSHPTFTTRITGKGQVGLAKRYGKQNGVEV